MSGLALGVGLVAAWLLVRGEGVAGGLLVWAGSGLDGMDGEAARLQVRDSAAGALLDGVLDRVADTAVLAGLAMWAVRDGMSVDVTVGLCAAEGHEVVLSEGGPTVIAGLLQAGLLNEFFLTLSPILAGRSAAGGRPGLVEGIELLPSQSISGDLLSIRKHGSHLFLRHAIPT